MSRSKRTVEKWLNENSILQDLSAVQGRVPVALDGAAVGSGEKPPALNIQEDTEEEYYQHYSAVGDVLEPPDLGMIKEMLHMVKDVNINSVDEHSSDNYIVISKLNSNTAEMKSKVCDTSTPVNQTSEPSSSKQEKKKKEKRKRNFAIESILQSIADKNNKISAEPVSVTEGSQLRKPEDFLTTNTKQSNTEISDNCKLDTVPTSIEKVNGWIETQTKSPFPKKSPKVVLDSSGLMFKKKSVVKENVNDLQKSNTSLSSCVNEYKPSGMVNEYYEKYLEQSKFKESVKGNLYVLWSSIEGKIKEFNEKRHKEAESSHQSFEETQNTDKYTARIVSEIKAIRCTDAIALSQHRHKLPGPCVVCQAVSDEKRQKDSSTNEKEGENIREIAQENEYVLRKCPYVIEDDNTAIVRVENIPESFLRIAEERVKNEKTDAEIAIDVVNDLVELNDSKDSIVDNEIVGDPKGCDFVKLIDIGNDSEAKENVSMDNNCSTLIDNNIVVNKKNIVDKTISKNVQKVDLVFGDIIENEDVTSKNVVAHASVDNNMFYENVNCSTNFAEAKEDGAVVDCLDYVGFKEMGSTENVVTDTYNRDLIQM